MMDPGVGSGSSLRRLHPVSGDTNSSGPCSHTEEGQLEENLPGLGASAPGLRAISEKLFHFSMMLFASPFLLCGDGDAARGAKSPFDGCSPLC